MRLHELAAELRRGQRLRISEIGAVEPLEPGSEKLQEGPQEPGCRRWWTPALTDAQVLAYWNRIVLKYERFKGGNEIFAIITPTDGSEMIMGVRSCT